jgi:hypothetical protein
MPAPVWTPPHPVAVFRVLKHAWRTYMKSGNACSIDVTTPPDQLATAPTTVAGTVWITPSAHMPATVTASLYQGAVVRVQNSAVPVNRLTGAYTVTFPGASLVAGTAFAYVGSAFPTDTTSTPTFNVT